jgi:hypothetical protein
MTQPTEITDFSALLHDIAKAAFALARDFAAKDGDGNENAAFQALIMARLVAAAHEVSRAGGKPDKHFGQAHYCYRNAEAFAEESLHMMMHGGELLDLDRLFSPGPAKTHELPAWWSGDVRISHKEMSS